MREILDCNSIDTAEMIGTKDIHNRGAFLLFAITVHAILLMV